jgi:hypothetical protein
MQKNLEAKYDVDQETNEKYKYDKNAVVGRKFPFTADEFKYPNNCEEKPKSLYIKSSDQIGSKKPNQIELSEKYFPINNTFTKEFNHYMYKNASLNTAPSKSNVHASLDNII